MLTFLKYKIIREGQCFKFQDIGQSIQILVTKDRLIIFRLLYLFLKNIQFVLKTFLESCFKYFLRISKKAPLEIKIYWTHFNLIILIKIWIFWRFLLLKIPTPQNNSPEWIFFFSICFGFSGIGLITYAKTDKFVMNWSDK